MPPLFPQGVYGDLGIEHAEDTVASITRRVAKYVLPYILLLCLTAPTSLSLSLSLYLSIYLSISFMRSGDWDFIWHLGDISYANDHLNYEGASIDFCLPPRQDHT